jgi:glycosyltransferase involved in cell wall biosynthesis
VQETTAAVLMIAYTNYRTDPRVMREARAASSAGFDVDFLALRREDDPARERIDGVNVLHLSQQRYRGGRGWRYIAAYLEFFVRCLVVTSLRQFKRRYRVVHVNNMPDFFVFCALVPKLLGARIVLDIHDPMPDTYAAKFRTDDRTLYRLLLWQERASAWFADRVITVNEPLREQVLVKQHGIDASKISVVANFADEEIFRLRHVSAQPGRLRLVFHGTILERYGLRGALLGIASMKHKYAVHFKIIGEGDFSESLKTLIGSLGLQDIVDFDNQMHPLVRIPSLLADRDVGVVPMDVSSITDYALPLKLCEYTALGMPCVTVHNKAIDHYFGDDTCMHFDLQQPATLSRVLDELVEQPQLLEDYRRRVVALRDRLAWDNEKRKYVQLLRELAGITDLRMETP